jgi:catechol 2,3-dioxygenase-like lactoylglutathione lyase family enzyme
VLDHVSVGVTNIDRSRKFYDAALRPLGLVRIVDFGEGRGSDYGAAPGSLGVEFTITNEAKIKTPIPGAHLCFRAPDRKAVDAFYAAALAAGGRDDGAPGLRPHYHADYYCAFVLDPDGHRIEAVCHAPKRPVILAAGRALSRKVKHLTFSDMTIVGDNWNHAAAQCAALQWFECSVAVRAESEAALDGRPLANDRRTERVEAHADPVHNVA